jgi:plastocyanin
MTNFTASQLRRILCRCTLLIALIFPVSALADNWQLQVGAQNGDKAHQALAFLPNEIWIHSGDSITWAFVANEVHTVTFLTGLSLSRMQWRAQPSRRQRRVKK